MNATMTIKIVGFLFALLFAISLGTKMNPKFKVQSGQASKPAFYEKNTHGLYFGDIQLTPEQKEAMLNSHNTKNKKPGNRDLQERKFYKARQRWPGGKVFYEPLRMGPFAHNAYYKRAIKSAMQHIEAKTCIRFIERASASNRIRFVYKAGCNSPLGMVGGVQQISLGKNCNYTGVVVHELCHSLGFMHEQNRPDRDEAVLINWRNIPTKWRHAFTKQPWSRSDTLGILYDFGSIMQYEPRAFAANKKYYTIIPRAYAKATRAAQLKKMGNIKQLAPNDIKAINQAYNNCKTTGGSSQCERWAKAGECRKNPRYMLKHCRRACGKVGCADKNRWCSWWARSGHCNGSRFMRSNCRLSCRHC